MSHSRSYSTRKKVVFSFGILLVLFLCLEGSVRAYQRFGPSKKSFMPAGYDAYVAHPFLQYVLNPEIDEYSSLGFRGEEFPLEKPGGEVRIFCLGGSSTFGTNVPFGSDYPSQLQADLESSGCDHVRVVNAGVPGYNSANLLALLQFRILPLKPDVVVFYTSFNDCGAAVGATETESCYESTLTAYRTPGWIERLLSNSALIRVLSDKLGLAIIPTHLHDLTRRHMFATGTPVPETQVQRSEAILLENMASCIAIARSRGCRVLFVGQVLRMDVGVRKWVAESVLRRNRALGELAAHHDGVEYFPLHERMETADEYFAENDALHMTAAGNQKRAQLIGAELRRLGWCDAPPR